MAGMMLRTPSRQLPVVLLVLSIAALAATPARAQLTRFMPRRGPVNAESGTVGLPYVMTDGQGNQWVTYANGMTNMQGNFPIYNQMGQLTINNEMPAMTTSLGRIDPATHELILENLQIGSFTVTRRLLLNTDGQYLRYIDVFSNPTAGELPLNLQISSNINYGLSASVTITDPTGKKAVLGWAGQINGPVGKAPVEMFAGRGAKLVPTLNWPRVGNQSEARFTLTVPAGKTVAIMHLHGVAASMDAAQRWAEKLDTRKLLADVPAELRRRIVNFPSGSALAGDLQILRGDVLDVIELRGGDRFDGNLTASAYPLQTRFGRIDLPVDSVIAMVNVGRFHPQQLLVTRDGQIYGGELAAPSVEMELISGQKTQIPLDQIARLGYRRRGAADAGDSEDTPAIAPPFVLLDDGERLSIDVPAGPINVATRCGTLALPGAAIASVVMASDESDVQTITLTDGSQLHGLLLGPDLALTLSATPNRPTLKLPIAEIQNLVLHASSDDSATASAAGGSPVLALTHNDRLCGTLTGTLQLATGFDTLNLAADQVRALARAAHGDASHDGAAEVTITGWDGATFRGQLQQDALTCHLSAGNLDVQVPINLLQSYVNPQAAAPQLMAERIKKIVADLNADDWKQRDAAEEELVKMGKPVAATLRALRDQQPPEAQQRIDSVLAKLDKLPEGDKPVGEPMVGPDGH